MFTDSANDLRLTKTQSVLMRDLGPYSARNSSKGALIDEAFRIFRAISSGLSMEELRTETVQGTLLSQRSSTNRKRIWTSLQQRYLVTDLPWITTLLAERSHHGAHSAEFVSLLYLLYALRDSLTFDFVAKVLWPRGHNNRPIVSRNDVLDLLKSATPHQPQIDRWSEATRIKLAGSVLTALRDFGVLQGSQKKFLIQPKLPLSTAAALLHGFWFLKGVEVVACSRRSRLASFSSD